MANVPGLGGRTHCTEGPQPDVSEPDGPARRPGGDVTALADFPYLEYFAESHSSGSTETNGKTSSANRSANRRNTESHPTPAQERRRAHPRVPNRTRGREADRGLQRQPVAAPGPDHDPD